MRDALRRWLIDRGGLVAVAAFAIYIWISPTVIVDGDNAEMCVLGSAGGVAHPTGYPAYLLWLRATAWLPGATPAHTAAIATAILAAIQLLVLHAACRAWGARATAASFAVAIYASGPVTMRYSSEAEVFAMNQLVVATVLLLAARSGPLRGVARVAALGLAAGIGIADHVTCVLAAPVGLLGAVRGVREAPRPGVAVVAGVAGLFVGLMSYAYLLITHETPASWGTPRSLSALLDHVLRRAYGGPGEFASKGGEIESLANVREFALTLGRTWWWIPALGGLAMLGLRCARASEPGRGEPRLGWRLLALSFAIAGPLLAARFNLVPEGLVLYVVRRFHWMSTLMLALPVAAALDVIVGRYEAQLRDRFAVVIAVLGLVTAATLAMPELSRVRTPAAENAMRTVLRRLPPNAVVFASLDIVFLGLTYVQQANGERPDVTVVHWPFVGMFWYRERLARDGLVIDTEVATGEDQVPSTRIAERILASGRPLYVEGSLHNILKTLPSYPEGVLFRVLPRGQVRPSLDEVAAHNRDWFAALDLDYPRPGPDDEYPAQIHLLYRTTWSIVAQAFAAEGRRDDAANAADLARTFGPRAPE